MIPGTRNDDERALGPSENANENKTKKNTGIASVQNIISPSRRKYHTKCIFVWTANIRSSVIRSPRASRR